MIVQRIYRSGGAAAERRADVITPPSLLELLRTERSPLVPPPHPSATA